MTTPIYQITIYPDDGSNPYGTVISAATTLDAYQRALIRLAESPRSPLWRKTP